MDGGSLYLKCIVITGLVLLSRNVFSHGGEKHEDIEKVSMGNKVASEKPDVLKQINLEYLKKVKPIFQRSCFNCHSDKTKYPWYYKLPGARQLIDKDIKNALSHLDLSSDFPFGGHGLPKEDLLEIKSSIDKGNMPLWYYKILHPESDLDKNDKKTLFIWIEKSLKRLEGH